MMEKITNLVEMTIVLFSVGLGISFTGQSFFTVEISNVHKQEIGGTCLVPKGTIKIFYLKGTFFYGFGET